MPQRKIREFYNINIQKWFCIKQQQSKPSGEKHTLSPNLFNLGNEWALDTDLFSSEYHVLIDLQAVHTDICLSGIHQKVHRWMLLHWDKRPNPQFYWKSTYTTQHITGFLLLARRFSDSTICSESCLWTAHNQHITSHFGGKKNYLEA